VDQGVAELVLPEALLEAVLLAAEHMAKVIVVVLAIV
jgi:hypothetical protein